MHHSPHTTHRRSHGFTLVELLVAMVLTLILITAIAQFYAIIGDSVKDGRAMIEISGRVRAAVNRLTEDLDNITVSVAPWTDDGGDAGFFEYGEGLANDSNVHVNLSGTVTALNSTTMPNAGVTTTIGDGDDLLAFTIRSLDKPLTGRYLGNIIHSELAEVIWWVGFTDVDSDGMWDTDEPRYIYRRQLLIRPDKGQLAEYAWGSHAAAYAYLLNFFQNNDVSASIREEWTGGKVVFRIRANSLADLSRRENRFGHTPIQATSDTSFSDTNFPHSAVTISTTYPALLPCITANSPGVKPQPTTTAGERCSLALQGDAAGDDIMLSGALAFDVQAYDPYVKVWPSTPAVTSLLPDCPGYSVAASSGSASTLVGMGGFVDLGYVRNITPAAATMDTTTLSGTPSFYPTSQFLAKPGLSAAFLTNMGSSNYPYVATYDTWAISYERDGINQDGDSVTDEATNGYDDDGMNGTDDTDERETTPPYGNPLRGIRVRIRVYEPSTRQARQATVAADFINE